MDESIAEMEGDEEYFPIPSGKCEVLVAEWVLGQEGIDVRDLDVWEKVRQLAVDKFKHDLSAKIWRMRWMLVIDRNLDRTFGVNFPKDLPIVDMADPEAVQLEKAASRFLKLQEVYKRFASPLSISVHSVGAGVKEPGELAHSIICTSRPQFLVSGEGEGGPSNKLFEGVVFYLPRSTCVLKEAKRWSLELLIGHFGGTVTPRESDMDRKTIVLATGDHGDSDNLLRLKIWYRIRMYCPKMIRHCIKKQRKLDKPVLDKFRWMGNWKRSNFPDAYKDAAFYKDEDKEME